MRTSEQTESQSPDHTALPELGFPVRQRTVRFTVDMPESLHRQLSIRAAQQGRKKVELVREWIAQQLENVEG
jgi:predicted HicB family RNase H-like nuclease